MGNEVSFQVKQQAQIWYYTDWRKYFRSWYTSTGNINPGPAEEYDFDAFAKFAEERNRRIR